MRPEKKVIVRIYCKGFRGFHSEADVKKYKMQKAKKYAANFKV